MRLSTALFDVRRDPGRKTFELLRTTTRAGRLPGRVRFILRQRTGSINIEVRESAYAAGNNYRFNVGTFHVQRFVSRWRKDAARRNRRFAISGCPASELIAKVQLPATK